MAKLIKQQLVLLTYGETNLLLHTCSLSPHVSGLWFVKPSKQTYNSLSSLARSYSHMSSAFSSSETLDEMHMGNLSKVGHGDAIGGLVKWPKRCGAAMANLIRSGPIFRTIHRAAYRAVQRIYAVYMVVHKVKHRVTIGELGDTMSSMSLF